MLFSVFDALDGTVPLVISGGKRSCPVPFLSIPSKLSVIFGGLLGNFS